MDTKKTVLVVDDEDAVRRTICLGLKKGGYDVTAASNAMDAIDKAAEIHFNAAILDIRMPETSGFEVMHEIISKSPETAIIILTAMPDPESRFESLSKTAGVYAYLRKPCKINKLRETVAAATSKKG